MTEPPSNQPKEIKLVATGDGAVGKTCLLMCYAYNRFAEGHIPTVFDTYTIEVVVDGQSVSLGLWDTAGQEDYDRLRPLSYANANVFIACFNLTNKKSLHNIEEKWIPELKHYGKNVPVILVGCQKDLRTSKGDKCISTDEGKRMSRKLKCTSYVECSAKTLEGVQEAFRVAVKAAVSPPAPQIKDRCKIL